MAGGFGAGLRVRDSRIAEESGIHGDGGDHADSGDWGDDRDFQRGEHGACCGRCRMPIRRGWCELKRITTARRIFRYANYLDLRAARPKSIERLGAYRPWTFNVSGGAEPAQAEGAMISADLFDALGVAPELGRGFTGRRAARGRRQRRGVELWIVAAAIWRRSRRGGENDSRERCAARDRGRDAGGIRVSAGCANLDAAGDRAASCGETGGRTCCM